MIKVALTGGIGVGKSFVLNILKDKYNFPIFAIWCGRGSFIMFLQERIIFQKISQKKTI